MSFFKNFPTIQYDLFESGGLINVKNIFRHVDVNDIGINSGVSYTYYDIPSGARPDVVSQKLYGTTDYYWTFFVLNDFLKEGLRAWPKSEQELERYITNEYDKTSILVSTPNPNYDGSGSYSVDLTGLDLSHPYLRVIYPDTNAFALIDRYDPAMYQLHVHKVSNPDQFFSGAEKNIYLQVYNPYNPQDPRYEVVEALNLDWIESTYVWASTKNAQVYNNYQTTLTLKDNRTEFLQGWYEYAFRAQDAYFSFYINFEFELGRNAPYQYNDSNNEPITAYDALVQPQIDDSPLITQYATLRYEQERIDNFAKRKIRVVKKSQIQAFVEEYRNLINK